MVTERRYKPKNYYFQEKSHYFCILSDTNAPLRGIKNISEYNYYIFSIFVYILDAIEEGKLKENNTK